MFFVLGCLLIVLTAMIAIRKAGSKHPYSLGAAMSAGFSLLALVCLSQNYTQSLIPLVNDGIGVSNRVAYWILGEDGWSQAMFRRAFEWAGFIAIFFLMLSPAAYLAESRHSQIHN
ncbi:hypothetical protein [Paenibacillus sp. PL2-23]|uniref:hypothetical protein n=1 Tax=Paenibacillus sp. PL2-23 TaxID=2100729 RepID=UPI0030F88CF8